MKNYKLFSFLTVLIIFGFFLYKLVIADTGISFAYDYLLNKLDLNNTNNSVSIKTNNENNEINKQLFSFVNIKGIIDIKLKNHRKFKPSTKQLEETDSWIRSNGGDFSNKYSIYNQINKNNVNKLKLDFKIDLDNTILKKKWMNNVETNPIYFDGLLYIITPFKELLAIDILNKKIKWKFKSLKKIDSRGITLWINQRD